MPRQMRMEYPGALYHALTRRDRREPIFLDAANRHDFLKTLADAWTKLWVIPFMTVQEDRSEAGAKIRHPSDALRQVSL